MSSPAVDVVDLVKRYGAKTAVDGLSLTVDAGSITAVLGPNGAGKSTLVEICEGYRRPDGGQVRVLGRDPLADHRDLAPRIGVLLQSGGAWSAVRAEEMLRYVASLHARPLPVRDLVERLGLGSCGRTPYRRLSGGEQQRLGLALAVVGRPELVFLDEPTAGLDPQARRGTWELVEQLAADGVTVVLTTHYLEEVERLASWVHVIDHGRLLTSGTPHQLTSAGAKGSLSFRARPGLDADGLGRLLPTGYRVESTPAGTYRVLGTMTPQVLATVTAWCAAIEVMPEGLTVERNSLEDVFLELTGRELRG